VTEEEYRCPEGKFPATNTTTDQARTTGNAPEDRDGIDDGKTGEHCLR
jgi:hypothetical protein